MLDSSGEVSSNPPGFSKFTFGNEVEEAVFRLLAEDNSYQEIASQLKYGRSNVYAAVKRINGKLKDLGHLPAQARTTPVQTARIAKDYFRWVNLDSEWTELVWKVGNFLFEESGILYRELVTGFIPRLTLLEKKPNEDDRLRPYIEEVMADPEEWNSNHRIHFGMYRQRVHLEEIGLRDLGIQLYPVPFGHFMATNNNLVILPAWVKEYGAALYHPETSPFANPLVVRIVVLLTLYEPPKVLIARRSQDVKWHPGTWYVGIGELMEATEDLDGVGQPDPYRTVFRAIDEELAIPHEVFIKDLEDKGLKDPRNKNLTDEDRKRCTQFIAVLLLRPQFSPDLTCVVRIPQITCEQLHSYWQMLANDKWEHGSLEFWDFTPDNAKRLLLEERQWFPNSRLSLVMALIKEYGLQEVAEALTL